MQTPSTRVSLSPEETHRIHGKKRIKYIKKNPPTVSKISSHLRGQDIMEYYMWKTKASTPEHISKEIKNLSSSGGGAGQVSEYRHPHQSLGLRSTITHHRKYKKDKMSDSWDKHQVSNTTIFPTILEL